MKQYIEKCLSGANLTPDEASDALGMIMSGTATEAQIAGLLVALRAKGESVDELVGFARTMREKAARITIEDPDAVDIVGTGGDGLGTFNISTVASLVAAGAGVTVAKHGNKSASGKCGSADVLAALDVNIQLPPERVRDCVNTVGFGFLFAPLFHPAMKHAAKPRLELGLRTIFNMLGPLTNPAGVHHQVIGTYAGGVAGKLAEAARDLGSTRACVVHNSEGMDEVGLGGSTAVYDVHAGDGIREYSISADDFGLPPCTLDAVQGGDAHENARIALEILGGEKGPRRNVVIANAAMGIFVGGRASSLPEAAEHAAESIDSGRARLTLQRLIEYTTTA